MAAAGDCRNYRAVKAPTLALLAASASWGPANMGGSSSLGPSTVLGVIDSQARISHPYHDWQVFSSTLHVSLLPEGTWSVLF